MSWNGGSSHRDWQEGTMTIWSSPRALVRHLIQQTLVSPHSLPSLPSFQVSINPSSKIVAEDMLLIVQPQNKVSRLLYHSCIGLTSNAALITFWLDFPCHTLPHCHTKESDICLQIWNSRYKYVHLRLCDKLWYILFSLLPCLKTFLGDVLSCSHRWRSQSVVTYLRWICDVDLSGQFPRRRTILTTRKCLLSICYPTLEGLIDTGRSLSAALTPFVIQAAQYWDMLNRNLQGSSGRGKGCACAWCMLRHASLSACAWRQSWASPWACPRTCQSNIPQWPPPLLRHSVRWFWFWH